MSNSSISKFLYLCRIFFFCPNHSILDLHVNLFHILCPVFISRIFEYWFYFEYIRCLTDAEILKTSNIFNQSETASANEATDEENIFVVEPIIRGNQAENCIHELRRYVYQQPGISDNIFFAYEQKTNKNNRFSTFIENNVCLYKWQIQIICIQYTIIPFFIIKKISLKK